MANNQGSNQSGNMSGNMGGASNRGFASMDPDKQRAIASQGGRAAHASGNAHQFTSAEASAAGRKGGTASHSNRAQAKLGSSANSTRGIEQPAGSGSASRKEK